MKSSFTIQGFLFSSGKVSVRSINTVYKSALCISASKCTHLEYFYSRSTCFRVMLQDLMNCNLELPFFPIEMKFRLTSSAIEMSVRTDKIYPFP